MKRDSIWQWYQATVQVKKYICVALHCVIILMANISTDTIVSTSYNYFISTTHKYKFIPICHEHPKAAHYAIH